MSFRGNAGGGRQPHILSHSGPSFGSNGQGLLLTPPVLQGQKREEQVWVAQDGSGRSLPTGDTPVSVHSENTPSTVFGSAAMEARRERRARLAQRCIGRVKEARRKRLQAHRIGQLTEATKEARENSIKEMTRAAMEQEIGKDEEYALEDLVKLEEEIFRELLLEEEHLLMELEKEERRRYEELDYYAKQQEKACSSSSMSSAPSLGSILCPVCCTDQVYFTGNVFHCNCGFRIDAVYECLSINQLQDRLNNGFQTHYAQSGCPGRPFCRVQSSFGPSLLVMECETCKFYHVIL